MNKQIIHSTTIEDTVVSVYQYSGLGGYYVSVSRLNGEIIKCYGKFEDGKIAASLFDKEVEKLTGVDPRRARSKSIYYAAQSGLVWHVGTASGKYIASYLYETTARSVAADMTANGTPAVAFKFSVPERKEKNRPRSTARNIVRNLDAYEIIGIVSVALFMALMFSLSFGLIK